MKNERVNKVIAQLGEQTKHKGLTGDELLEAKLLDFCGANNKDNLGVMFSQRSDDERHLNYSQWLDKYYMRYSSE